ncbi:MAG TPA: type II secretion system F family protein [Pirellulales bacterium]|jgi:tight adherence protein B|nr:type II secretion system F family protein [Pirellulales bacterium]
MSLYVIIVIATFVCVTALVAAVAFILRGNSATNVEDRLAMLTGAKQNGKNAKQALLKDSVLAQTYQSRFDFVEFLLSRFNLRLLFEQADAPLSVQQFLVLTLGFALVGGIAATVAGLNPGLDLLIAGCCLPLPLCWLIFRRRRRFSKFAQQLPDAMELIARALRAGHSLASGFNLVAEEMTAPIGKEFGRVFEEQNLGIAIDEALDTMTNRIPNLDLRFFATAVILQRQTGGDLAEILDKIGNLVRERFKIYGQVQALTGEGRLSGVVLMALPPVLFLAVYRLNPEYEMSLFTDPLGQKMLIGGVVMQILGGLAIKKIVDIKV